MAPVLSVYSKASDNTLPHIYLIPRRDLLVEYAARGGGGGGVYSEVFSNSSLTGIALKGESILHFLVSRNEVFPNMQIPPKYREWPFSAGCIQSLVCQVRMETYTRLPQFQHFFYLRLLSLDTY